MKQFPILICLLLLFSVGFSVGASKKDTQDTQVLIYKGESEHWSVISKVTIDGNTVEHIDVVKYKGNNNDSVGKIVYKLESIAGSSEGKVDLSTGRAGELGTIVDKGGGGNVELISKVTTVLANIEWNGKVERFELKKQ
ncbi:hypothetical protein [Cytobacillus firmus]|uniref:hypothetical protein n=1 Tax=Cytobacillus firmus TaxID=1399 RepID=UPI00222833C7|nr:hypothetical protein [Cytobacillus firmus]